MTIFQSLSDASVYRTVALIPQQTMFALILAGDDKHKNAENTRRSLALGHEFCDVFGRVAQGPSSFHPATSSEARLAAGIKELPQTELLQWAEPIHQVQSVIARLLAGESVSEQLLLQSSAALDQFASFAKSAIPLSHEGDDRLV